MPDLTRFDFHVVRFMNSEAVREMTAEEVGQYILLLCESWLLDKDASLPDSPKYLAKIARCDTVSDLVLSKFPIIQTSYGDRRRNPRLFEEWLAARERSASAAERGRLGVEARRSKATAQATVEQRSSSALKQVNPNPYQSIPSQLKPNQSDPIRIRSGKIVYTPEEIAAMKIDDEKTARSNQETMDQVRQEQELAALSEGKPW